MSMKRSFKRKTQGLRRQFKKSKSFADLPIPLAPLVKQGHNLTPEEQLELIQLQRDVAQIDVAKELDNMTADEAAVLQSTLDLMNMVIENHNREVAQKRNGEETNG